MRHPRDRRRLSLSVLILLVISLLGPWVWGGSGPLPARDWNLENLQRIEKLQPNPLTFAVLGDNRDNAPVFERLLQQMERDPGLQFAILLGDLVESGSLEKYQGFFQSLRGSLNLPLLAALGNHELAGDPTGRLYSEIFGPRYYSFQLHGNCFIILDGAAETGPDEVQFRWLTAELQKAQACKTRLVFLHIPLFDPRGGEHHHSLTPGSGPPPGRPVQEVPSQPHLRGPYPQLLRR